MATFVTLATLLLTVACGAPGSMETIKKVVRKTFPEVKQIAPETLEAWLAGPGPRPLLLDVRKPEEFAVSHLPGAALAPDLEAARKILEGEPQDRRVVVYCSVGYRSSAVAEKLAAEGFSEIYNLEGSIFEWANSGRAVEREGEEVQEVHPYGAPWGRLLREELRWRP